MGGNTQHLTDTPDPEDTGAVGVPENEYTDETTVFQQVGLEENANEAANRNGKPRPKWLVPAVAAGVAVIVLGAGVGGYAYALNNVNAGVQAASTWNKASAKTLHKTIEDAQALLDGTGEDQVADPQVLKALKNAVDKAKNAKGINETPNSLFVWELLDAENAYDESTASILDLNASLDKAVKAVEQSVEDKTLQDAKDALSKTIDSAQSTLDGSDGKVQDNATRDALSKALETARKTLDGSDVEAMDTAKSDVEAKANAVNESVKAKEQVDAEAQAAADAANAAANATTSTGSGYSGGGYTGGGYSGGGYAGGGYSGGGYTQTPTQGGWDGVNADNNYTNPYVDSMGNVAHPLEGNSWSW